MMKVRKTILWVGAIFILMVSMVLTSLHLNGGFPFPCIATAKNCDKSCIVPPGCSSGGCASSSNYAYCECNGEVTILSCGGGTT